jgi:WD domain, G-beta repeat
VSRAPARPQLRRSSPSPRLIGQLPDGTPVIVSGGDGGESARVWRLADGTLAGGPVASDSGSMQALATGVLPDGTPVIIGATSNGLQVRRLADGTPVGEPLRGDWGPVQALVTGALPDGTPVVVGGSFRGKVWVWRLADGAPVGEPLPSNTFWTDALATGVLRDGTPVIVSGGPFDGIVRVWRLGDGSPVGEPLPAHAKDVSALATGVLRDGTPVIVSGGDDGTVRVWRLGEDAPAGEPTGGHGASVRSVTTAELPDGTPVVVSGGDDGLVRVWRLADGSPVGSLTAGHGSGVKAVTTVSPPGGTTVVVSGSDDGTLRLWRLADGAPVVVSGSDDGTVQVRRLADGTLVGETLGNIGAVNALAAGALPEGTPVIVSGSGQVIDGMVRLLLSLSSPRKKLLFTCGRAIMAADEEAIRQVPAGAWAPGLAQDGDAEDDKDVAEITGLTARAGNWPDGLRRIARRVKPSRRHIRNLTDCEKETGWKYSITCTNIPDSGIPGVPGSHHPQYIDVAHRQHAVVETSGVRTAKAMGLRNLQDLAGQRRLGPRREHRRRPRRLDPPPRPQRRRGTPRRQPGNAPLPGLAHPRPPRPPCPRPHPEDQPRLVVDRGVPHLLAAAPHPASTRLTSTSNPSDTEGERPRLGRSRCAPGHPGHPAHRPPQGQTDMKSKNRLHHDQ